MTRLFLIALMLLWPASASACNACVEDKIAATYDWSVVSAAKERGHTMVFTAIRGPIPPRDASFARTVRQRLAELHGVDAGTVRVSLAPPAASFACDRAHHRPGDVVAAANRALAPMRLSLAVVRLGAP